MHLPFILIYFAVMFVLVLYHLDHVWWNRLRRDHQWGQTFAPGSTSDQNALNSLFEGQMAHAASHAGSPYNIAIVSAGYVLTASRTQKIVFDTALVDSTVTGYTNNAGSMNKVAVPERSWKGNVTVQPLPQDIASMSPYDRMWQILSRMAAAKS
jgi:hypothetical protein